MLRVLVGEFALVSVPILLFFAWRGWAKRVRAGLSPWRNGLAISALTLLSLNWLVTAVLEVPVFFDPGMTRLPALQLGVLMLHPILSISGILLAFALRRSPRLLALVAALLMIVSWPLGYA